MINDIIDNLKYEDGELAIECPFPVIGNDVLIVIDANSDKVCSDSQVKQLTWLYSNIEALYPKVEAALFSYCLDESAKFRHQQQAKSTNTGADQAEVWNEVSQPGIWIRSDLHDAAIHLEYECSFDAENGVRVVIENGEVTSVGT